MLNEFLMNVLHNLFKPLLLFFYAGLLIPAFKVNLEFPKAVFQGMTIYLLLAIGWHGGEELAGLEPALYGQAAGFMLLGFFINTVIGFAAYQLLRWTTRLRKIDAATVAGHYGSDSAGTFVTAVGVLVASHVAFAPYMPVMLAIMEIPGCLVALFLVSKMRNSGMDAAGNMPGETGYSRNRQTAPSIPRHGEHHAETDEEEWNEDEYNSESLDDEKLVSASVGHTNRSTRRGGRSATKSHSTGHTTHRTGPSHTHENGTNHGAGNDDSDSDLAAKSLAAEELEEARHALQDASLLADEKHPRERVPAKKNASWLSKELLHEVFLNPGIFLLFAGIVIGCISRLQGEKVTAIDDALFVTLLHGVLCLFQLEMGRNAASKIKDLAAGGWQFVVFALLSPNLFAGIGIAAAHLYSMLLGQPFEIGTYVLFAILCGSASTIAVPAVQRLAIPEASPTLPLVASLGLTFTYNVTLGIPIYTLIATLLTKSFPIL